MTNKFDFRLEMVRSAQQYGISETARARLVRIPPRACTWQSEVERSNGIIEYELLDVDRWRSKSELVSKSTAWEYYFNRLRPNFPPMMGLNPAKCGGIPLEAGPTSITGPLTSA